MLDTALHGDCVPSGTPEPDGRPRSKNLTGLALDEQVNAAGVFVYEAGLHPVEPAQTTRVRDGQPMTEPGSGANPGEVLAGFSSVDTPAIQTALDWAQRIPTVRYGKIEVRQVVEFDQ